MNDRKINLEKVLGSLGENVFPNIHYFMDGVHKDADGNVDGSNDGLYKGLVRGEGLEELGIAKNVLESDDAVLQLCKIILEKNGTLFFSLGLLYSESPDYVSVDDDEFDVDEDIGGRYHIGGYGIYLSNDGWSYGYYSLSLFLCYLPPEEEYYYLDNDEDDIIAMTIMKNIDEMDIYD